MFLLISLVILASIALLSVALLSDQTKPVSLKMNELEEQETAAVARQLKRPKFFKILGIILPFNKLIVKLLKKENIRNKLLAANLGLFPEDFFALKEMLLAFTLWFLFQFQKTLALETTWIVVGALIVGIIAPDIWLKIRNKIRTGLVVKDLPDVIDLLALCVNAGLDFSLAVNWVVEKSKRSPLIEELELFLMETRVGKSRRQALQDLAKRFNLPEVHSFTRALIQAERLGTPVEAALNILSEEMRDYRFRRGEQKALQAPIKLLFPLIFFIMPVVAVIVAGPILLQFMGSGFQLFK